MKSVGGKWRMPRKFRFVTENRTRDGCSSSSHIVANSSQPYKFILNFSTYIIRNDIDDSEYMIVKQYLNVFSQSFSLFTQKLFRTTICLVAFPFQNTQNALHLCFEIQRPYDFVIF